MSMTIIVAGMIKVMKMVLAMVVSINDRIPYDGDDCNDDARTASMNLELMSTFSHYVGGGPLNKSDSRRSSAAGPVAPTQALTSCDKGLGSR